LSVQLLLRPLLIEHYDTEPRLGESALEDRRRLSLSESENSSYQFIKVNWDYLEYWEMLGVGAQQASDYTTRASPPRRPRRLLIDPPEAISHPRVVLLTRRPERFDQLELNGLTVRGRDASC
jgi:hypothetical protein